MPIFYDIILSPGAAMAGEHPRGGLPLGLERGRDVPARAVPWR